MLVLYPAALLNSLISSFAGGGFFFFKLYILYWGFPGSSAGPRLILELGRSPGEENGNPFQYSCLENPMDRGAW